MYNNGIGGARMDKNKEKTESNNLSHAIAAVVGIVMIGAVVITGRVESTPLTTYVIIGLITMFLWTGGKI